LVAKQSSSHKRGLLFVFLLWVHQPAI